MVHPKIAVYSAGRGNAYGHPHAQTLANLLASGAVIYGTDTDGTVVVETDGETLQISTTVPATLEFTVSDPAVVVLPFDPLGPDQDRGNFSTHEEAQAFFVAAGGPERDPHRLDGDDDGIACESLP